MASSPAGGNADSEIPLGALMWHFLAQDVTSSLCRASVRLERHLGPHGKKG